MRKSTDIINYLHCVHFDLGGIKASKVRFSYILVLHTASTAFQELSFACSLVDYGHKISKLLLGPLTCLGWLMLSQFIKQILVAETVGSLPPSIC